MSRLGTMTANVSRNKKNRKSAYSLDRKEERDE